MPTDYASIVKAIQKAIPVAAATPYHPEAKLRELVEPLWNDYVRVNRINIHFEPRNERALANGRADTVFNRLIVEYKKPGVIKADNAKNRQLITQVKGYIEDLSKEERWKEERLLGVAFDGNYFLFVRRVGRWIEEDPVPVSAESVERFLLMLEKLTSKAALVPDNLIRDFAVGAGSLNYIASNAIRAFYFGLTHNVNDRVRVFFEQWALQFSEVHGAIENKKFDAKTLFESYGFKKAEQKDFNFLAFFFALDTYYGLLMKLLAYQVVGFYTLKNVAGLPLTDWENLDSDTLQERVSDLEDGGVFRRPPLSIRNFLEGDLLSWYLNDWNDAIESAIRAIIERLNQYDPETMELVPDETRDILKKLYQFLVPKQIRHDLGEYYTPDWLADRCLNQVGYGVKDKDLLKKRLLDPGCGSGTFVILGIKRARENARLYGVSEADTLDAITRNIVGFDLNPLAVISARTNYLLAIADLLPHKKGEITIPIYLCDSINPPSAKLQADLFDQNSGYYTVPTSVGPFRFPDTLVKKDLIQKAVLMLEDGVKKNQSRAKFLERVHGEMKLAANERDRTDQFLGETYAKLVDLEERGINGIWARIIKNAFAPLFVGQFDFVAGNPPWVNWESLPDSYREATAEIWQRYNLFEHVGMRARLGAGKDDISVLMTYVALDKYLKDKGRLCFVITQSLFKTMGGGEGFRRFRLGKQGEPIKMLQVDDMTDLQPFEGATNRTAVFLCQKGEQTVYPVEYHLWKRKEKGTIAIDLTWAEVQEATRVQYLKAQSIDGSLQGPWISAKPKALKALKNVVGQAAYQAREGTNTGGANGVYWISLLGKKNDLVEIENLSEVGKRKVDAVRDSIEPDLVYPLLRGRDIDRWSAIPSGHIVIPHRPEEPAKGFPERQLKVEYPNTFKYLENFRASLAERKSSSIPKDTFYSIFAVGPYTFGLYKVVWSEVGYDVKAAVVGNHKHALLERKVVVPDHTVVAISFDNTNEAHYACAILNSSPAQFIVRGYVVLHPSPHILDNIRIMIYDKNDDTHRELVQLSKLCHEKVAAGIDVSDLEEQIDELAAEVWGLTNEELTEIKTSLEEM